MTARRCLFDDTFLHDAANETDQVRVVLFLDRGAQDAVAAGAAEPAFSVDRAPGQVGAGDPRQRQNQSRLIAVTGPAIFSMRAMASASGSIATSI